ADRDACAGRSASARNSRAPTCVPVTVSGWRAVARDRASRSVPASVSRATSTGVADFSSAAAVSSAFLHNGAHAETGLDRTAVDDGAGVRTGRLAHRGELPQAPESRALGEAR